MTMLTRLNPFARTNRIEPFVDFDDLLRGFGMRTPITREFERTLDLRLDVCEDDNSYLVNVDMPGVRKEDIDVTIEGNQISLRTEVKRETKRETAKEIYSERYSGSAYRAFTLPTEVDSTNARASYDNGVLTLILPKKGGSAAKHVPIN